MGLSELPNGCKIHLMKRRKLIHSTSPTLSTSPSLFVPLQLQPGPKAVVCTSCHRAFPGAKQSQLVQCARCHAPTCAICSRTCNGVPPPSVPPTPKLTMSPVSPASPGSRSPDVRTPPLLSLSFLDANTSPGHLLGSGDRRPALASHTNMAQSTDGGGGKRRKRREHEQGQEDDGRRVPGESEKEAGIVPGCGRVVCRGCSFETPEIDLNTCYDCAGHEPVHA
ncbi:hypothetical protein BD309DRAFT_972847 [Dichomitus squalens]|uniref:Uncharacterized protein n=1 Tax=Dichomitus squalens TaxID=114155 RepID=A0A4Q9NAW6_9APHY|nr:hypothetical protein BD311DRAFT_771927 [Dichomitus squalens]TBU37969.1 hypothetical protein BD309DRAFT_972847 [Dichomitus squalens]TBU53460.1 hypothetical protein BD310DRAFT_937952 [Dichomitus squalens]